MLDRLSPDLDDRRRLGERSSTTAIILGALFGGGIVFVVFHLKALWAVGVLWALAATAVGSMVGFLFGIPRILQSTNGGSTVGSADANQADGYQLEINTNLEQISDWLTKIIVGLGLVQLGKIPGYLLSAASYVSVSFASSPGGAEERFACALLVYFPVIGCALGYLLTRLYLTGAFAAADRAVLSPAEQFRAEVKREAQGTAKSAQGLPNAAQVAAAEKVGKLALNVDEPVIHQQIEDLAREYERMRSSLRAGADRTQRMYEVVVKMRTLGLAARFMLPELMASNSPGERLAAIALLSVTPDPDQLTWLGDRFKPDAERPFVVYHAAVALAAAAAQLDPKDVRPVVEQAKELATKLKPDPARDAVLETALKTIASENPRSR